ncbi:hypothetical protein QW131_30980 [Roseibium salinum]|nr:hypothetical protein [Roseibium salinum]
MREEALVERLVGAGGSRRAQHTAAELLLDGIAAERDEAQGLELLAAAAYAGHAEALLRLAEMTAEGEKGAELADRARTGRDARLR